MVPRSDVMLGGGKSRGTRPAINTVREVECRKRCFRVECNEIPVLGSNRGRAAQYVKLCARETDAALPPFLHLSPPSSSATDSIGGAGMAKTCICVTSEDRPMARATSIHCSRSPPVPTERLRFPHLGSSRYDRCCFRIMGEL